MKCRWCGEEFIPKRPNQIACSNKCAYLSYRHSGKSKKEIYLDFNCVYCGKKIKYNEKNKFNFSNMKTCGSKECSRKIRYLKIPDNKNFNPKIYDKIIVMRKRINKISNNRKKSIKKEAYKILGNKCIACDFNITEILQPHHIHGRDKSYRDQIGDLKKAMKKGILKKEFVLLCPNHHAIHTYQKVPIEELHKYK